MMPQTFKNAEHQKRFETDGYIVLPGISSETLQGLTQLFNENFVETDNPRSNFNAVSEEEKTNHIINQSTRLLAPCFNELFFDYTNHGATFFVKNKNHGELGLHQDTTIIDFEKHFACYAWVPLIDVTEQNGCICLIEKSHLFFQNFISFTYKNGAIPLHSIPSKYIKKLPMKAGDVLFFDNRLFHGSLPNQTNSLRVAINSLITSPSAPLVYYQKKDENTATEYFVTAHSYANSYRSYSQGLLPDGAVFSRDLIYRHTNITPRILAQKCFWQNIKDFFFR